MTEAQKYKIRDLYREVLLLHEKLKRLQRLADYLDDPQVMLQIQQPHRLKISELLHEQ